MRVTLLLNFSVSMGTIQGNCNCVREWSRRDVETCSKQTKSWIIWELYFPEAKTKKALTSACPGICYECCGLKPRTSNSGWNESAAGTQYIYNREEKLCNCFIRECNIISKLFLWSWKVTLFLKNSPPSHACACFLFLTGLVDNKISGNFDQIAFICAVFSVNLEH